MQVQNRKFMHVCIHGAGKRLICCRICLASNEWDMKHKHEASTHMMQVLACKYMLVHACTCWYIHATLFEVRQNQLSTLEVTISH